MGSNSKEEYLWPFSPECGQPGCVGNGLYPEQHSAQKGPLPDDQPLDSPELFNFAVDPELLDSAWLDELLAAVYDGNEEAALVLAEQITINEQEDDVKREEKEEEEKKEKEKEKEEEEEKKKKEEYLEPVKIDRLPICKSLNDLITNWARIKVIVGQLMDRYGSLDEVPQERKNEVQAGYHFVKSLGSQLDEMGEMQFRLRFGDFSWEDALKEASYTEDKRKLHQEPQSIFDSLSQGQGIRSGKNYYGKTKQPELSKPRPETFAEKYGEMPWEKRVLDAAGGGRQKFYAFIECKPENWMTADEEKIIRFPEDMNISDFPRMWYEYLRIYEDTSKLVKSKAQLDALERFYEYAPLAELLLKINGARFMDIFGKMTLAESNEVAKVMLRQI